MKVAIVHDWLLGMRGGERCLEVILEFFADADIFTLFYDPAGVTDVIRRHRVQASSLNSLPASRALYRHMLPFYSVGVRDLERKIAAGNYDLVVSISHCVAKNVRVPQGVPHLCYCLTPARYLFDQYDSYFKGKLIEPLIRPIAASLRRTDVAAANGVTHYMAISEFVRDRIRLHYGRDADVVYPPCRTDWIKPRAANDPGDEFLCVSALVPYKNVDLIVLAFNQLGLPLTIVGSGPLESKLRADAASNIHFVSDVTDVQLGELYRRSKALIFAAEEDFGMVPVEMQAAGRPVICYGKGGVLETVSLSVERPTGVAFSELSVESLADAVRNFMVRQEQFTVDNCLEQARKFSLEVFREDFSRVLEPYAGSERRVANLQRTAQ